METTTHAPPDRADELVRRAHERAYRYDEAFEGFRAHLEWRVGGRAGEGTVVARPGPDVQLEVDADEQDRSWLERELRSIVGHRQASTYESGDGRHAKRVGENGGMGTHVELEDGYDSAYTIDDAELTTVTRTIGERRFTIVVHERAELPDGRTLPTSFSVFYWGAGTGDLSASEAYRDAAVEVDGVFLPGTRTIVRGDDEGLSLRSLTLSGHVLLEGAAS